MKTMTMLLLAALAFPAAAAPWAAEKVARMEGFRTPESVASTPGGPLVYVSNVVIERGGGAWKKDGAGYISLLSANDEGQMKQRAKRWSQRGAEEGKKGLILNGPKGMALLGGGLWIADIDRLVRLPLEGPTDQVKIKTIAGAKRLNDVAIHDNSVYVSDTATGKIHHFSPDGRHRVINGPPGVNGITFAGDTLYAVSFSRHEAYVVPTKGDPEPLGVAGHFKSLDGVEVLEDGSMIVADFKGGKVSVIAPDHQTVRTLIELQTPADIGLDRQRMLLYVPSFKGHFVEVYKLRREG